MESSNPRPRGRRPKPVPGRDAIYGDALYPVTVLLRKLGLSRGTLSSMRRRGLPIRHVNRRCAVVLGSELIQFLRKEWTGEAEAGGETGSP
jgi:hypothetical protein